METYNPWWSIWVKPRQTIQQVITTKPRSGFVWLSAIYGFSYLLHLAQLVHMGASFSLFAILIMSLLFSIPVGMFMISLMSILVYWLGKLLKGKASYLHIRAAVTWSLVPQIFIVGIWIISLFLFDSQLFMHQGMMGFHHGWGVIAWNGLVVVEVGLGIWGLVILLHALGQVQGFSAWLALLNVILAAIAEGILFFFLLLGLSFLSHLGRTVK